MPVNLAAASATENHSFSLNTSIFTPSGVSPHKIGRQTGGEGIRFSPRRASLALKLFA